MGVWEARNRLVIPTRSIPNGTHQVLITDMKTGKSTTRPILIQHMQ